jgi:hypothetical protein
LTQPAAQVGAKWKPGTALPNFTQIAQSMNTKKVLANAVIEDVIPIPVVVKPKPLKPKAIDPTYVEYK